MGKPDSAMILVMRGLVDVPALELQVTVFQLLAFVLP